MTQIDEIIKEIDEAEEEIMACFILGRRKIKSSEYYAAYEYIDEARKAVNKILEMFP